MAEFVNKVQGGGIRTTSVQQPPVDTFGSDVLSSAAVLGSALFSKPKMSESDIREQRRNEGLKFGFQDMQEANSIVDLEERRNFINKRQMERRASLTATASEEYGNYMNEQFGSPIEAVREEVRRELEAEQMKEMQSAIQFGRDSILNSGGDPNLISDDDALAIGMRAQAKEAVLAHRAIVINNLNQETDLVNRDRTAKSNLMFESFLYDQESGMHNVLSALKTRMEDPSTQVQAVTEAKYQLEQMKAQQEVQLGQFLAANGGSLGDIPRDRINSLTTQFDFYIDAISGKMGSEVTESILTNRGWQLTAETAENNPKFGRIAYIALAMGNRVNSGAVMEAFKGDTSTRGGTYRTPASLINIAGKVEEGTPPSNAADTKEYYTGLSAVISTAMKSANDSGVLQGAAVSLVHTLMNATRGPASLVSMNHSSGGLPALYRQAKSLEGPSLVSFQQEVQAVMEREGTDVIEMTQAGSQSMIRTKILPAFRAWNINQVVGVTTAEVQGGKLKLNFNATTQIPNAQPRSIYSWGEPQVRGFQRDMRTAEQKLNEYIDFQATITGYDRADIAEVVRADLTALLEIEKSRQQ